MAPRKDQQPAGSETFQSGPEVMGRGVMLVRSPIGAIALAAALVAAIAGAQAFDEANYPDLKGQWLRTGGGHRAPWDPSQPPGLPQQAPPTPQYQALYQANPPDQ